jgi:hypothetical protein
MLTWKPKFYSVAAIVVLKPAKPIGYARPVSSGKRWSHFPASMVVNLKGLVYEK